MSSTMIWKQHPLTKAQRKALKEGRRRTTTAYTRAQMRWEVARNMPANVAGADTSPADWPQAVQGTATTYKITNP